MTRFLFLLLLFPFCSPAQQGLPPVGFWREHLPYHNLIDLTASEEKIYAATPYSLFNINPSSGEMDRMSKVTGLSETGISAIQFDPASGKLYIAYTNSNIDVLDSKGVHNIPDIKRENIAGDKTIYQIFSDNKLVYLATGLGIIVLDAEKFEVNSSWFIGSGGNYVKTNGITKANGFFYAATEEGLKKISASGTNQADFRNWQTLSGSSGLSASPSKAVISLQNRVFTLQNDSLFIETNTGWNLFFANGLPIKSVNVSGDKIFISQPNTSGPSQVVVMDANGNTVQILRRPGVISVPQKAIFFQGGYWVADYFGKLSHWSGNEVTTYYPNSPLSIATGEMKVVHDVLYAAAGSVNEAWNYQFNSNGIYQFRENTWSTIRMDSMLDFITLEIDRRDGSLWAGSFGGGLLHFKSASDIKIYKQNSPVNEYPGDPGSYRVSGLAFDRENNLWVSNFGAGRQLHVLKNDGSWRSFTIPFTLFENAVSQIIIDEAGQKWIVSPKGNGLIVFNDNGSIDNPSDDRWRIYRGGTGNGNLPSAEVWSIAQDKSGFIWVGTSDGVAVIQCPQDVFLNGCEAILPVIREGSFNSYLFKGEKVNSIAVDGADRKWIATRNGVWLINPEGTKVLAQFTEENSPLPSNDVRSIAINGRNGEVYFGTAKGIISFRGTATEAEEEKGNVLVFPNPVPPGYTGSIAIRGLPGNAIFKITELDGRLVYQGRTSGGQAVWNGKNYKGAKVSTGIYLVLAGGETGKEKAVARIVFIDR